MAVTLNYGFTSMELDENTGFKVAGEVIIPDTYPPVLAWAGTQLLFSASEIPTELRSKVLYTPPAERRYLHAYFSYGGGGLKIVVLETTGGGFPDKARVINYNLTQNPFTLVSVSPEFMEAPWNRDVNGWWIANAFTRLTFRATASLVEFPVLWVGALFVKDNLEAMEANTYLYICGVPLDESYEPLQFLFRPSRFLLSAAYSWRHIPVFTTERGLIAFARDIVEGPPLERMTVSGPVGLDDNASCLLEIYPNPASGLSHATLQFTPLPDTALPVVACHEHLLSGFSAGEPTRVLSLYEGRYWDYDYAQHILVFRDYNGKPIALVPSLSVHSYDGALLVGANYQHTYFTVTEDIFRVTLIPQFVAFLRTLDASSNTLYKYGFLPFNTLTNVSDILSLPTEDKLFLPSVDVGISQRRGIISYLNGLYYVDIDSNAIQKVLEVRGADKGVKVGILSPCAPLLPQNYAQACPIFGTFYYKSGATEVKPFSAARVAHPTFLPNTQKMILSLFVRPAEVGGSDWSGDRGKIYLLETGREALTSIENITISVAGGAIAVVFDAPVTKQPVAFLVENPPFPYLHAGPPDPDFVIADSISQPHLFEKDVSGGGAWVKMGQTILRRSAYEAPFRIRVFVLPKNSHFLRVVAYKVGGGR